MVSGVNGNADTPTDRAIEIQIHVFLIFFSVFGVNENEIKLNFMPSSNDGGIVGAVFSSVLTSSDRNRGILTLLTTIKEKLMHHKC